MQKKVNVTVNNCKSGKFMDLTSKLTVNTYVISKCLLISHSVHLRISDISNLSSKVKSWVFQDILEKPQELVLFMVALVCSVFYKSLACLIRTFMETVVHPWYIHLQYINIYKCGLRPQLVGGQNHTLIAKLYCFFLT